METKNKTAKDLALEKFRPLKVVHNKKDLSGFLPKDEIFNKQKTYLKKNKQGENFLDADWRNLNIGGAKITLFKDSELSKEELSLFDKGAKSFYLVAKKITAKEKAEEKAIF